jgi:gluconate 2-dehydrogenase gamma chain
VTAERTTSMTTLDRRELLKRVAYLMGGAISAPLVSAVLNGCSRTSNSDWQPAVLTQAQADLVAEVVEIMIPRTDTPGAKDVGVPQFIDVMLKEAFSSADRERFLSGLNEFDALAVREYGHSFNDKELDSVKRLALVQRVQDEAIAVERGAAPFSRPSNRPFILMTKELTLLGFFMSEVGATQVLQYEPVPGAYHGCVPLAAAGKGRAWATDSGAAI